MSHKRHHSRRPCALMRVTNSIIETWVTNTIMSPARTHVCRNLCVLNMCHKLICWMCTTFWILSRSRTHVCHELYHLHMSHVHHHSCRSKYASQIHHIYIYQIMSSSRTHVCHELYHLHMSHEHHHSCLLNMRHKLIIYTCTKSCRPRALMRVTNSII